MMTPHGPDAQCFDTASNAQLKPVRVADGTQVNRTMQIYLYITHTNINSRHSMWKACSGADPWG